MRRAARSFWRFSLRAYRAPGVAAACLALQDGCGADVNLLLYCAWLGRAGRELSGRELRSAVACVAPWQAGIVRPLRAVRRSLPKRERTARRLRERVAAAELEAERVEQTLLAGHSQGLAPAPRSPPRLATTANLARYLGLLKPAPAGRNARRREALADWPGFMPPVRRAALPPRRAPPRKRRPRRASRA